MKEKQKGMIQKIGRWMAMRREREEKVRVHTEEGRLAEEEKLARQRE